MTSLITKPLTAVSYLAAGAVLGPLIRPCIFIAIGFAAGWAANTQCQGDVNVLLSRASASATRLLEDATAGGASAGGSVKGNTR